jgi:putative ABC transport system substrate-binding protein
MRSDAEAPEHGDRSEWRRPDALFVGATPFFNIRRVQLVQLAAFHRLPATYAQRDAAQAGGLMTYGPSILEGYRQGASTRSPGYVAARGVSMPMTVHCPG